MNILFNGKRIVKWLLRLLPFIEIAFMFLFYIAKVHNMYQGLGSPSGGISFVNFNNIWNNCSFYSMRNVPIVKSIRDFFQTYFFNNVSYDISSFICTIVYYELIVSLLFLIYDVFNFMISVASNWLNKGERLND